MTNEELLKENQELKIELENLKLEISNLKRIIFGSKREATPRKEELQETEQCSFFDQEKVQDKHVENQIEDNIKELTVYKKKNNKKGKAGIKKSAFKDVEIQKIEYVIEKGSNCPECNGELKVVAKEVVRQEIDYIPAKLVLKEYVQYTYKCEKCGTNDSEKESSTFYKAVLPKPILTHSFVSPTLATEVIYQKYFLGAPLYRQEKMWEDKGLVLPRSMMSNWCIKISDYYFSYLYDKMLRTLKEESKLLHCDETEIQCNKEVGRKATSNSYMWVLCSGDYEEKKGVIFKYAPSKSEKTAQEFLKGYEGILVTDGYASYNNIEGIKHAECWAHCRRYFYESIPLNPDKKMDTNSKGYTGLEYCDKLFEIERKIADLSTEKKVEERQEKSKPVLDAFFEWVDSVLESTVVLNNKLKKALVYASNQRKELSEFLTDGRIPLSNSKVERAIRPFAVHRKNWLFADSVSGATANAVMYSLIESAKMNSLNIHKYIQYLLEELPQLEDISNEDALEKYLPWSKELPANILNFQCTDDVEVDNKLFV